MADDANREANEVLNQEIQRLEKEKEELERKNRERQLLEQKLRELRGTVSSLRSGDSGLASTPLRGSSAQSPGVSLASGGLRDRRLDEGENGRRDIESALQESRDNLQCLQSQSYSSPSGSTRGHKVSSRDKEASSDSSSDSEKGDDVMSERHKHAIQAARDVLVDNMIPDDIFNDLISRKILTTADVSRIKEKNTREAINEELLNILCRRSDRAFHVFVQSLRKTLQEYLANRIDPPSTSKSRKKKRKRQTGEINISLDCEDVEPISLPYQSARSNTHRNNRRQSGNLQCQSNSASCLCQEVEEQILQMAKDAYRNIRRRDATPASFEQFRKELQQTNVIVKDSMEIMHTLKILCRHGDITEVSEGSIVLTVRCHSAKDAKALWDLYTSGKLHSLMERGFVTQTLKNRCGVVRVSLKVGMSRNEYLRCLQELGGEIASRSSSCHTSDRTQKRRKELENSACGTKRCRTDVTPVELCGRHGITSASLCCHHDITSSSSCLHHRPHPRRAFQEILYNNAHKQCVPSKPLAFSDLSTNTNVPLSLSLSSPSQQKRGERPQYNLRLRPAVVYR